MVNYETRNGVLVDKTLGQAWGRFCLLGLIMPELLDCGRLLFDNSLAMSNRAFSLAAKHYQCLDIYRVDCEIVLVVQTQVS